MCPHILPEIQKAVKCTAKNDIPIINSFKDIQILV